MNSGHVYILGTCDTKQAELTYLRQTLRESGIAALIVDTGTRHAGHEADISARAVARCHPKGEDYVFCGDRGRAIAAMAEALCVFLRTRTDMRGVLAIGGSGGTALVAPALQALPIGLPKLVVSTVASGNTAPYVGGADIAMLYPVTDMEGLNRISRVVLGNAAHAMAGMARSPCRPAPDPRPAIGLTMFGVTTPCVEQVVHQLSGRFDCLVFHATGTGGRAMERLADDGMISGFIDTTLTEFCDYVAGGIFACDADRLGAVIRTGLPYVGSCGGLDMVNFGARASVPAHYRGRVFVEHNPQITLMRTNAAECRAMGHMIGHQLNRCAGEVRFLYPEGGFSVLDQPGGPFHDPEADEAFYAALAETLEQTAQRRLIRLPHAINDPAFAAALAHEFSHLYGDQP
ncbi:Tm-1-like ATP-binding domain-containing protein [Komagataeibacter sp. AV436]|uniref:Tm-1-like ATP-binding domain-containing protein n=1 Tax=Komagataeibacter melomenusus TaxID=2766578 RepID=A0ABX2AE09_9PROT|nr:Tm-1-like ATP-binding domain-containing protein [Komagataeibacter melomenusus]MBV1830440.1 Tm-1-like ATP-binding domain-containing protein [Komagataeibacter melomenusus]NPC66051.1 Tm-1-like ATP-binding domain-containing protein [Komagataeibacter melomenusus]